MLATTLIVDERNETQDFQKTDEVAFTTNADTEFLEVVATLEESTGKVSITGITIEQQGTETQVPTAIVGFFELA